MASKISCGIDYLDHFLNFFKTGDNVIWEVEAGTYIEIFLKHFIKNTLRTGYKVVYVSFNVSPATLTKALKDLPNLEHLTILDCFTSGKGNSDPLFAQFYKKGQGDFPGTVTKLENPQNLSHFRVAMDRIEIEKGAGVRYIFDSLTGMQDLWGDENSTFKFFTSSCPRLYDLQTIAYWILEKEAHTTSFKANLRHITQVAIDLSKENGDLFFKVIKIEGRFFKSVFLPKRYELWSQEIIFPSAGGRKLGQLGDKIKTLRKKLGITQKELAQQVGLTPSFISQLEKNLISPSIDSLLKLSETLHTPPTFFLTDSETGLWSKMLVKPRERQEIQFKEMKNAPVKLELLISEVLDRRMEPYLLTLKEGAVIHEHFSNHKGDEFAYILEGDLEVEVQGKKQLVKKGDSLYFESAVPSRWANMGKGPAVLLWVLSPPRKD